MFRIFTIAIICIAGVARAQQPTIGTVVNDPRADDGLTLLVPEGVRGTYLIDDCGRLVRKWTSPYATGMVARMLAGGRLLRTAKIPSAFSVGGSGGRIEIYDWSGALQWGYDYVDSLSCQHHDAIMMPNGHILTIAWEVIDGAAQGGAGRDTAQFGNAPVWSERIVELAPLDSAHATIVWEWHAWDHIVQNRDPQLPTYGTVADHPELLDINYPSQQGSELYHFNAVDYNAALDEVLVCSPFTDEIYVIDHSTTTAEAASHTGGARGHGGDILYRWGNPAVYGRGTEGDRKFYGQHDAQWIKPGYRNAGKIMVFNNGANRPDGAYTSIEIIDPPANADGSYTLDGQNAFGPAAPVWNYVATPPTSFFAKGTGGAHMLPNGDVLACQSTKARVFEIDTAGTIVWEYRSPVTSTGMLEQGTDLIGVPMFRSYRYARDSAELRGLDLTPGAHLEVNPILSACDSASAVREVPALSSIAIFSNPFHEQLTIQLDDRTASHVVVTDVTGRVMIDRSAHSAPFTISTADWPSGVYCVRVLRSSSVVVRSKLVVKF